MSSTSEVRTSHNAAQHRYEAHLDGELAGFAEYVERDGVVVMTHTEVDDRYEGHGVGSALVRYALDDLRADGSRRVAPRCPFVAAWIEKHPEYADLVA